MPALAIATPREVDSVEEFAERIGLSAKSVRRAIDRGDIHAFRIGRRIFIPRSEVVRLVADASLAPDPRQQGAL